MKVRKGKQPGASVVTLPHLKESKARDEAGKAVGVSGSLIDRARNWMVMRWLLTVSFSFRVKDFYRSRLAFPFFSIASQPP